MLTLTQRYIVALKWLLIFFKKKKKLLTNLNTCFYSFLEINIKNLAILQKKKTYLLILKYKHLIKL